MSTTLYNAKESYPTAFLCSLAEVSSGILTDTISGASR